MKQGAKKSLVSFKLRLTMLSIPDKSGLRYDPITDAVADSVRTCLESLMEYEATHADGSIAERIVKIELS